jgi:SAM-dependent methyltransferase
LSRRLRRLLAPIARAGGDSAIVADRWSGLASEAFVHDLERVSWSGIPQVHQNHDYLITGSRATPWVDWLRDRFFPGGDAGDTLSLGCGAGHLDRIFKQCGFRFRSFTGIDISEEAIERARALADEVGLAPVVRYTAGDLNRMELAPCGYDFIYFFQSLHHIEALEHVLGQCQRALRPNGVLLVNEFVGPSRFQWTAKQIEMANQLAALLPEELRRDVRDGGIRTAIERPTIRHMIRHDPSEAVRSSDIEALVKSYFDVVGEWNWGGTLNHLLFQNIAANFDPANAYHQSIAELLIHHENVLVQEGVLPSDFKVFVARSRALVEYNRR